MKNLNPIVLGVHMNQDIITTGNEETSNAICGVYNRTKRVLFLQNNYNNWRDEIIKKLVDRLYGIEKKDILVVVTGDHFEMDTWNKQIEYYLPLANKAEQEEYLSEKEEGHFSTIKDYKDGDIEIRHNWNLDSFAITNLGFPMHTGIHSFDEADKRARYMAGLV